MTRLLTVLIALLSICRVAQGQTVQGVECAMMVHQLDTNGQPVLLSADTTEFVQGIPATGFLTGFSIEVEMIAVDSATCDFRVHAVTLGPPVNNYAQQYRVEYTLPAKMSNIIGKEGTNQTLTIQPLRRLEIDTTGCGVSHHDKEAFKFSPSGYMDIYYAEKTFGEFYWTVVKGIFEDRYRFFRAMNNFNLPGKYLIYLAPCQMHSVIWDKRFGMMVDPTRNAVFGIYTRDFNSTDPFLVLQASVFKNYGYAPHFLSEGLAGYLSLAEYDMKKIVAARRNIPLNALLDTYAYLEADPEVADKTAASLAKYLVNQYKPDKFIAMYKKAQDLNLREVMTATYGKSVGELETEWLNYVDTVTIPTQDLALQRDLAEAMFDFAQMKRLSLELLKRASNHLDTLDILPTLVRASFSLGDYYDAVKYQQLLATSQPDYANNWLALAGYLMMNGQYDEAGRALDQAGKLDSTSLLIEFNRGILDLHQGDSTGGWQLMASLILRTSAGGPQAEARALYGNYLARSDSPIDQSNSTRYCSEAINTLAQGIRMGNSSPDAYLWTGIAYLGLGDTGNAWDNLWLARFIDVRPFYQGLANLWLGKVADLMGDHAAAQQFYAMVIAGGGADYHQAEARQLSREPYRR